MLFNFAFESGRRCVKECNIKGMRIKEGEFVRVNVLDIHYDADVWGPVDPNTFYPPRHSPLTKRHPLAFWGFGNGPRNCIGMKFAVVEMKLALVKLLQRYELHASVNTPERLEFTESVVRTPKYGVNVLFRKRSF